MCVCSRLNRKAKYNLEKDLADKFQALGIDGHNAELHLNSQGNRLVKDAGRMTDKYCVQCYQWRTQDFSMEGVEAPRG